MPKKKWCPTRKPRHFNEAWAEIAARENGEKYGSNLRTYKCFCGWWHVYDRNKARAVDEARESRTVRRIRRRREIKKEQRALKLEKKERRRQLYRERVHALQCWEDDGGSCST